MPDRCCAENQVTFRSVNPSDDQNASKNDLLAQKTATIPKNLIYPETVVSELPPHFI